MSFLFLLLLLFLLPFFTLTFSQTPPKGLLIDCGATTSSNIGGRVWLPDVGFTSTGTSKNVTTSLRIPTLSTVRSFSLRIKKHCYHFQVYRGARYMVRSTYFYGEVNGPKHPSPPAFDQIVDGTFWSMVNTAEDYANGNVTYYEGVFLAQGKTMSFCIAPNARTDSDPFISALELVILGGSLYNTTNFTRYGLSLVARHSFGYSGPTIRYPDDMFDRFWEPLGDSNSTKASSSNISVSGIWNLPPQKVFGTQLGSDQLESMELRWPPKSLRKSKYYIAFYFADNKSSLGGSRIFNISINGIPYYHDLNVTSDGIVVFASQWPLSGPVTVTLTSATSSSLGPLINAGEMFDVLPIGKRTLTRDVIALEQIRKTFRNPPLDWSGDPCMPRQYSWTGITCSNGPRIRVVTLNLTGMGLSGSLSPDIAKMSALTNIWLGNNSLSGHIPDLSSLKSLKTLHLEDNQLSGDIPSTLGKINTLYEVFLQNNNFTDQVPTNLFRKPGIDLRTSGNRFLSPAAP